jgi:predicted CoA-binding protein
MKEINRNIAEILRESRTIAVVGISDKPFRAGHYVAEYLLRAEYTIIPVNPNLDEIFGLKCYPNLAAAGGGIDIVDIFRRPEEVESVVEEAIKIEAKTIWMQLGVINEKAARRALEAGLNVIMDRCLKVEHAIYRS